MFDSLIWAVTFLIAYFHGLHWLMGYADLKNQARALREMLNAANQKADLAIKELLEAQDKMRSELNGINLKLGMRLK
jgi:hypothetical protein